MKRDEFVQTAALRKRSLLEDDALVEIDDRRDEASPGDVCEACGCARRDHADDGESCKCGKCEGFAS